MQGCPLEEKIKQILLADWGWMWMEARGDWVEGEMSRIGEAFV